MSIENIKTKLANLLDETLSAEIVSNISSSLVPLDQLRPPEGVPTGLIALDNYLLWQGLPKGDLTLLAGPPGLGGTSLWSSCVRGLQKSGKWAAWINSDYELTPQFLSQSRVQLERLLVAKKPEDPSQLFWLLQEMISSTLFDVIGCHLQNFVLKPHQLQKIKKLARLHQVSVVFLSNIENWISSSLFPLIIFCQKDKLTVRRALHRPTPFSFSGASLYVDFVSQLTTNPRSIVC